MREIVKIRSTESPHVYTTTKNRRNVPGRMQLKKHAPVIRVLYRETR